MRRTDSPAPVAAEPSADFHADIATRKISLLERLVAGILHELNSPLAVLSTNGQLLERVVARSRTSDEESSAGNGMSWEEALEILVSVHRSQKEACGRVVETLTSLRTCVSLDEAEWKLVDVEQLLDSVIKLLHSSSGRRVEIERDYEGSSLVEGSTHQLSQLFMNLLLNGMEAAGDGGSVMVSVKERDDEVVVTFRDDGDGIHPEDLPDIFNPGFSANGSAAGLGLTICQYIVKEHRGSLSIESEPGQGVRVRVRLPKHHRPRR